MYRRFEKAERELARALAIGRSLKARRETLDGAEQVCAEVANLIKARAMLPLLLLLCVDTMQPGEMPRRGGR